MELHRLDCLSSHGGLDNYEFVRQKQQEVPPEHLKPAPLMTGRDLIAAGYRPGPMFGIVLSEIEDAQLEGRDFDSRRKRSKWPATNGCLIALLRADRPKLPFPSIGR